MSFPLSVHIIQIIHGIGFETGPVTRGKHLGDRGCQCGFAGIDRAESTDIQMRHIVGILITVDRRLNGFSSGFGYIGIGTLLFFLGFPVLCVVDSGKPESEKRYYNKDKCGPFVTFRYAAFYSEHQIGANIQDKLYKPPEKPG